MAGVSNPLLVVPWNRSEQLSAFVRAINNDPTTGQGCLFQDLWKRIPFSGTKLPISENGLVLSYKNDRRGVYVQLPPRATNYEANVVQPLVNLKCALYSYVGLLSTPGQPTKVGKLFIQTNQTREESKFFMSEEVRNLIDTQLTILDKFAQDCNVDSVKGKIKPITPFSILWTTVLQIQQQLRKHAKGMQEVAADMIWLITELQNEARKVEKVNKMPVAFFNNNDTYWANTTRKFISGWCKAVASSINEDTWNIMTSWQLCWSEIDTNFKILTDDFMKVCLDPNSESARRIINNKGTDEDFFELEEAINGVKQWRKRYDETIAIMDQFILDKSDPKNPRRHPVQATLTQTILTVQDYSL